MNSELEHIFSDSPCPSEEMLIRYLEGTLSDAEKHNIELHLNGCEMCSDFVDGLSEMPDTAQLHVIEEELHKKIDILVKTEKKTNFPFYLRIAASLILLTGLTFIIYYQYPKKESKTIEVAQNETFDAPEKDALPPAPPVPSGPAEEKNIAKPKKNINCEPTPIPRDGKSVEGALKQTILVEDITFDSRIVPAATGAKEDTKSLGYVYDKLEKSEDKEEALSKNAEDEVKPVATEVVMAEETGKSVAGDVTTVSSTAQGRETMVVQESKISLGKKSAKEKSKNVRRDASGTGKTANGLAVAETPVQENAPVAGGLADDADNNKQQPQKAARDKFNDGEFQQVIQILDTLPMSDKKDEENQYYRGISYYKTGQYQKAYKIFNELVSSKSTYLKNEIHWYYALTLLSIGQKDEAKKQFESISTGNSPYAPDASKELDKLK